MDYSITKRFLSSAIHQTSNKVSIGIMVGVGLLLSVMCAVYVISPQFAIAQTPPPPFLLVWSSSEAQEPSQTSSLAWGDYDGDGDLDLAVGNGHPIYGPKANELYRNDKGILKRVWTSNEIDITGSIAWGDYDGDGDLDLVAGNWNGPNRLYRNDKGILSNNAVWSAVISDATYSLAWGDYDGDSDLDLIVGNESQSNRLYRNDGGTLTLAWTSTEMDDTWSVAWGDYDGDGDLDLTVGNDGEANRLYRNDNGALNLIWSSPETDYTHSVAWGDYDGDGDLDLIVGNGNSDYSIAQSNRLYRNDSGTLVLAWSSPEVDMTESVAWGDYDNDGDPDLAVGNGNLAGQFNRLYRNDAGNLTLAWSPDEVEDTRSVIWGDYDNDGDLDLMTGNDGEPNRLYRNEGGALDSNQIWSSAETENTNQLAWGDYDSDGDLDLLAGNSGQSNRLYRNNGGLLTSVWQSTETDATQSVAWGDYDGDGDLDMAVGNWGQSNRLYRNQNGGFSLVWSSLDGDTTTSVAWGDYDNDGDLDLAAGNHAQPNRLYRNDNGVLTSVWQSSESDDTLGIAWGDYDGDGDLDLAAGGTDVPVRLYRNDGGILTSNTVWLPVETNNTWSVAWGDYDGDGDLDLAVGNGGQPNRLYRNDNGELTTSAVWSSLEAGFSLSLAWGDYDNDGDLDLAVGNWQQPNYLYRNDDGELTANAVWTSAESDDTYSVAWGDYDGDGDLDLAAGNNNHQSNRLYRNTRDAAFGAASISTVYVNRPAPPPSANFYSAPQIWSEPAIPFTYTLSNPEGAAVRNIRAFYSLDGGGHWLSAAPATDTITANLTTNSSYTYKWDISQSGVMGQSDNTVLRILAIPGLDNNLNKTAGPYLYGAYGSATFPFRIRGSQARVLSGTIPVSNALVYRLPASQTVGARPYANLAGQPFRTDAQGYLQGRGEIFTGDKLVALLPVTATNSYTLYYTSAAPVVAGLNAHTVTDFGVQTLNISSLNPLLLLNLEVSLEWDSRNDPAYLSQLRHDIERTSQILYDLTNGRAALGNIKIYQAKEQWVDAHVNIYATDSLRPNAALGGIVSAGMDEVLSDTTVITNAYIPGQVRMGAIWNRFGNAGGNLGEDWPRALAHELGHYFLFLLDNYLGLSDDGLLIEVDCQGSAMTDPYVESYSEFLTPTEWNGDCLRTVAQQTTGRSDWETIARFYPALKNFDTNSGPNVLPLQITQIQFIEPAEPARTLASPFFSLTDTEGKPLSLEGTQAQGYLFKTQNNTDPTDDYVIGLGPPNRDQIHARGAEPGDRLCVFDYGHPLRLGCLDAIGQSEGAVALAEVSNWQPQVLITPVSSRTFVISVSRVVDSNLNVQFLPDAGPASENLEMERVGPDFAQTITTTEPALGGFVRVWVPGSSPYKTILTGYDLGMGWGGRRRGWSGRRRGWSGRRRGWSAPINSSDGQVIIFDPDNILAEDTSYSLQAFSTLPALPLWFTPVGKAYRFLTSGDSNRSSITFQYLQRDVPGGQEYGLRVYYSPDEGQTWQRLKTDLDTYRNLASAGAPGAGIYALISTIELPSFGLGWNNFGYPVPGTRAITTALASIEGKYSSVYHYGASDANAFPHWLLYDQGVREQHPEFVALVNDLNYLEFGEAYWLYATEPITLYLGVPEQDRALTNDVQLPPATFYGWLSATESFTPTTGMTLTAWIDGVVCGQTSIETLHNNLAYKLQVQAENLVGQPNACGAEGRSIRFKVGQETIGSERMWDNSQAWFYPLGGELVDFSVYLPLIVK